MSSQKIRAALAKRREQFFARYPSALTYIGRRISPITFLEAIYAGEPDKEVFKQAYITDIRKGKHTSAKAIEYGSLRLQYLLKQHNLKNINNPEHVFVTPKIAEIIYDLGYIYHLIELPIYVMYKDYHISKLIENRTLKNISVKSQKVQLATIMARIKYKDNFNTYSQMCRRVYDIINLLGETSSIHDIIEYSLPLNDDYTISIKRLRKLISKWDQIDGVIHTILYGEMSADQYWFSPIQYYEHNNRFEFKALTNTEALKLESAAMQHCVGSYSWQCIASPASHIYSIVDKENKHNRCTLQLEEVEDLDNIHKHIFKQVQLKGYKNADVINTDLLTAVDVFLNLVNKDKVYNIEEAESRRRELRRIENFDEVPDINRVKALHYAAEHIPVFKQALLRNIST